MCCGKMNQWFTLAECTYLNQHYENQWIHHGPIYSLPRYPDLTLLDFPLWDLMKEMTYRTKVHMREELLHQIMDAAAYI
jgi:hypothetical protein